MSAGWLTAVVSYSAQLAVLVIAARAAESIFRIRAPRPALLLWNLVLLSSVTLPFALAALAPDVVPVGRLATLVDAAATGTALDGAWMSVTQVLPWIVIGVVCLRLAWLGLGLARLSVIRRRSRPLVPVPAFVADLSRQIPAVATLHASGDVETPVTIGFRAPLILLPERALALPEPWQRAIVCHELIHVRRRDWLRTLVEQVWSGALWFHPAAYALLARLTLMREAVVDDETLAITGDRKAYVHALLAFAEPAVRQPLPVTHLIKPRHLPRRFAFIAQEVRMSRRHSLIAVGAALLAATAATAAAARQFPLASPSTIRFGATAKNAAQDAPRPGNGITVPRVIKEVKPEYTAAALSAKVQGSVHLLTEVTTTGEPARIRVTQSLDREYGLDDSAVRALSQWRFDPARKDGQPVAVTIEIEMTFTLKP